MKRGNEVEYGSEIYEEDEIDLKELLFLLLNNWRVIGATSILFLMLGVLVVVNQADLYQANVVLMVIDDGYTMKKIDRTELSLNQELVSTYTEIAKNKEISRRIIEEYGIDLTPEEMRKKIKVTPVGETEFIKIAYKDYNPRMAASIANGVARGFIQKVEEIMGTNHLKVVEKASTPRFPIKGKKKLVVAIAFVLGGLLGVFMVFAKEFFMGNIKKAEDISKGLNVKVVGYIPDFDSLEGRNDNFFNLDILKKKRADSNDRKMFFGENINTPMAEAFRKLRNNLRLDRSRGSHILAFTSSIPKEGKTTVSTNYALSQALSGRKVLLVDCDLRKPKVGNVFGIGRNERGLYSYLNGNFSIEEVITKDVCRNLDIITTERNNDYSPEMLHQKNLNETFKGFRGTYDLIILDTPPMGITSDVGIINEYVDGLVMVCGYNMLTKKQLDSTGEHLRNLEVEVWGVVVNKIDKSAYSPLGYYVDYYSYYDEYMTKEKTG